MSLIETQQLTVQLNKQSILSNVNLSLAQGDYLCLLGPNGAGKSTLIKTLLGIHPIHSGNILLQGKPLHFYTAKQRAQHISYVPQVHTQQHHRVIDFIRMSRYPWRNQLSGWTNTDQDAINRAFALTHTADFANRAMQQLSGGETQRIMIAAALAQQSQVLLLDEPCSFLDPRYQTEIHDLIYQLNQQHGISIIEASHDINHAAEQSQHILALKQGQVHWQGKAAEFLNPQQLADLYDQKFVLTTHPTTGATIALTAP